MDEGFKNTSKKQKCQKYKNTKQELRLRADTHREGFWGTDKRPNRNNPSCILVLVIGADKHR